MPPDDSGTFPCIESAAPDAAAAGVPADILYPHGCSLFVRTKYSMPGMLRKENIQDIPDENPMTNLTQMNILSNAS